MDDMKWKTLSSEYLFKDAWFTVRRDTCQRPDGKLVSPYYVYEFPEWVCALAITASGKVVLERQYRHGLGKTGLELPGGCVDPTDVDFEAAIARELEEETGYRFAEYHYLGKTSSNPSTNNNWMHMFLARGGEKSGQVKLDENEDIELHLITLDELKALLANNQLMQSMHVTTCFYALNRLAALEGNGRVSD